MYDDSIKLLEMPDLDSVSLCLYIEHDDLFELGERINEKFGEAYMNGYSWEGLIQCYVGKADADLMKEVSTDPEAGMYEARMSYSPENLEKMKRFEAYVRAMVADEDALMKFIETNLDEIEWG